MRLPRREPRPQSFPLAILAVVLPLAALSAASACRIREAARLDAGPDLPAIDVRPAPDTGPLPLALEFSATGCQTFDVGQTQCVGDAALTLQFTPIPTAGLTRFQWTFGDGSAASTETSPLHTYTLPGNYTVSLSAQGSAGTVTQIHANYVRVLEVPSGGVCDLDAQCEVGNGCWCGAAEPCDPILAGGFCAELCASDNDFACADGTTCVDFSQLGPFAVPPGLHSPWGRTLCLRSCTDDAGCGRGSRCRSLLAPIAAGEAGPPQWTKACFSEYPLAIGTRCNNATLAPANADCVTGFCAPLGRFGRCSFDCSEGSCPEGTACAQMPGGDRLCLAECGAATPCDDDPFLACEPPGQSPDDFVLTASAPAPSPAATPVVVTTYCAPRPCTTASDCGPSGMCPSGGGRCASTPAAP